MDDGWFKPTHQAESDRSEAKVHPKWLLHSTQGTFLGSKHKGHRLVKLHPVYVEVVVNEHGRSAPLPCRRSPECLGRWLVSLYKLIAQCTKVGSLCRVQSDSAR